MADVVATMPPAYRAHRRRELARLAAAKGDWGAAIEGFSEARKLLAEAWGAKHPLTASVELELAAAQLAAGQHDAARNQLAAIAAIISDGFAEPAPERRQLKTLQSALASG